MRINAALTWMAIGFLVGWNLSLESAIVTQRITLMALATAAASGAKFPVIPLPPEEDKHE